MQEVHDILEAAGFVRNVTYRETRFLKPPKSTYAVFNDTWNTRGADEDNNLRRHEVNIELYEYSPDPEAEERLEDEFDARAIPYIRQPRYWIDDQQLYQVIYEYDWIEKRGVQNG